MAFRGGLGLEDERHQVPEDQEIDALLISMLAESQSAASWRNAVGTAHATTLSAKLLMRDERPGPLLQEPQRRSLTGQVGGAATARFPGDGSGLPFAPASLAQHPASRTNSQQGLLDASRSRPAAEELQRLAAASSGFTGGVRLGPNALLSATAFPLGSSIGRGLASPIH
jgi:hypothetical protein